MYRVSLARTASQHTACHVTHSEAFSTKKKHEKPTRAGFVFGSHFTTQHRTAAATATVAAAAAAQLHHGTPQYHSCNTPGTRCIGACMRWANMPAANDEQTNEARLVVLLGHACYVLVGLRLSHRKFRYRCVLSNVFRRFTLHPMFIPILSAQIERRVGTN